LFKTQTINQNHPKRPKNGNKGILLRNEPGVLEYDQGEQDGGKYFGWMARELGRFGSLGW